LRDGIRIKPRGLIELVLQPGGFVRALLRLVEEPQARRESVARSAARMTLGFFALSIKSGLCLNADDLFVDPASYFLLLACVVQAVEDFTA
jgi:hypothetical protein